MKTTILLLLVATHALAQTNEDEWIFQSWATKYNKVYSSMEEFSLRREIFLANLNKIGLHNEEYDLGLTTFTMQANQFTDLTTEEFVGRFTGLKPAPRKNTTDMLNVSPLSNDVDWNEAGHVSKVKDQGSCGSCWAFSATGALEAAYSVHKGIVELASEQELVDCDPQSEGCNGGFMTWAFDYIEANGLDKAADYPYTGKDGKCNPTGKKTFTITGQKNAGTTEASLQQAVSQQPVAVAVAVDFNFQFYFGGVLDKCGTQLNHGVLATGFQGTEFWRVKNSWGSSWGETGYIRIKYGSNLCHIADVADYPTV